MQQNARHTARRRASGSTSHQRITSLATIFARAPGRPHRLTHGTPASFAQIDRQTSASHALHPCTSSRFSNASTPSVAQAQPTVFNLTSAALETQRSDSCQGTILEQLHVRDFALVKDQTLTLGPGLNVITGESGSGKSVLLEALSQLLGAPSPPDCIRPPAESALVEGSFRLSAHAAAAAQQLLTAVGLPQRSLEGLSSKLVVRREVSSQEGSLRSRCTVNGSPTSLRVLRMLGALLLDANGQHSSLALRDGGTQLELLDRVAGTGALAAGFGALLSEARDLERRLEAISELDDDEERARLQQLVDQVERSRLEAGEERTLRALLRQAELRRAAVEQCGLAAMAITGDGSGGGLTHAMRAIQSQLRGIVDLERRAAAELDEGSEAGSETGGAQVQDADADPMQEALEALSEAQRLAGQAAVLVGQYSLVFDYSEQQQQALRDRLLVVEKLLREHGCRSSEQLLDAAADAADRLEQFYECEEDAEQWQQQLQQLRQQLAAAAVELSRRRRAAAEQLRASVDRCLTELAMGSSRFDVRLGWERAGGGQTRGLEVADDVAAAVSEPGGRYKVGATGLDRVEFLLAAAAAEPLRPLAAVASGGESARVMLALKAAAGGSVSEPAAAASEPILVLDELDAGVGGRLGSEVGRLLRRMCAPPAAAHSQILCVTHLPQVAAHAQHHIKVSKQQDAHGRATTVFSELADPAARLEEVAAMLGLGADVAAEMMAAAQGWPAAGVQQLVQQQGQVLLMEAACGGEVASKAGMQAGAGHGQGEEGNRLVSSSN